MSAWFTKNTRSFGQSDDLGGSGTIIGVMLWLTAALVVIVCLLVKFWPTVPFVAIPRDGLPSDGSSTTELKLLMLVMLSGMLGAMFHALVSFVTFVGNCQFKRSWTVWYILRAPIGGLLALIFYIAARGTGMVNLGFGAPPPAAAASGEIVATISIFGTSALSMLVGMFSDNAAEKLRQVFDALLSKAADRKDQRTTAGAAMKIKVTPGTIDRATMVDPTKLKIEGDGFEAGAKVQVGDKTVTPQSSEITPKKIEVNVPKAAIPPIGSSVEIKVVSSSGVSSDAFTVQLT